MRIDSEYFPGPDHLPIEIVRQQTVQAAEGILFPLYPSGEGGEDARPKAIGVDARELLFKRGVLLAPVGGMSLNQMQNKGWAVRLDPAFKEARLDLCSYVPPIRQETGVLSSVPPSLREALANKTVVQQEAIIADWGQDFLRGIPGVKAVVGQMTDYLELLFTTDFKKFRELREGKLVIQTKTSTFRDYTALVGPRTDQWLWLYNSETLHREGNIDRVAVPLFVAA